jgi:hypothetical protein
MSGRFIFSGGKCVSTFANSVNVLQDKSANELFGLFGLGANIGQWAQLTNILESHITGDPTFRFASNRADVDIRFLLSLKDNNSLLKILETYVDHPDLQNVALTMLSNNGYPGIVLLLRKYFESSPYNMVRLRCMVLAEQFGGKDYTEILKRAVTDPYEFIRRIAVSRIGNVGSPELLPLLVQVYINDLNSERIVFNTTLSMRVFDPAEVKRVSNELFSSSTLLDKEGAEEKFLSSIQSRLFDRLAILDRTLSDRLRTRDIVYIKNVNMHPFVGELVGIVTDPSESEEVRMVTVESLAWFRLSYRKQEIMDACLKVAADPATPANLKKEATRTYNILKGRQL